MPSPGCFSGSTAGLGKEAAPSHRQASPTGSVFSPRLVFLHQEPPRHACVCILVHMRVCVRVCIHWVAWIGKVQFLSIEMKRIVTYNFDRREREQITAQHHSMKPLFTKFRTV